VRHRLRLPGQAADVAPSLLVVRDDELVDHVALAAAK
jgi:hypothetical protein